MVQRKALFLILLFLLIFSQATFAEEVILGKDSRPLFPAELTERFVGALPTSDKDSSAAKAQNELAGSGAVLLEQDKTKITKIEVVRVIPVRGNNPLNPIEPLNNATINGRLYFASVEELKKMMQEGGDSPTPPPPPPPPPTPFAGCIGKSAPFKATSGYQMCLGKQMPTLSAGLYVDFASSTCKVLGGDGGWNFLAFDIMVPFTSTECSYTDVAAFPDFAYAEFIPPTGSGFERIPLKFDVEGRFYLQSKKAPYTNKKLVVFATVKKINNVQFELYISNVTAP
ncbi:MAG: hypothetical protein KBA28_13240 [Syntrophaceae bacterium]|nr:hypothetical protein [Syntrophaceae bacterium]